MFKDKFNFNFWPSFTDLMLSVLLIVLVALSGVLYQLRKNDTGPLLKQIAALKTEITKLEKENSALKEYKAAKENADKQGRINLDKAEARQKKMKNALEQQLGSEYEVGKIIKIETDLDRQTISFSDKVLFKSGSSHLNESGQKIMSALGPVLKDNLGNISEIQVQGHADIVDTDELNMGLAAERAIVVYQYLQKGGIDPAIYLMSANSYGKYKPVDRKIGDNYDRQKLEKANADNDLKARNRRIDIVLTYKK